MYLEKKLKKTERVYELYEIFRELDTNSIDELEAYFIPNLSSIDALRVILYKYALAILFYKKRITKDEDPEYLHQFRVYLRKSRAFLKEFGYLMPKTHYKYFNDNLSYFATKTNQKRDLDVIQERLSQSDKNYKILKKKIKKKQKVEHQNIKKMLKSKTFKDFFYTYQDRLRQETLLTSNNTSGSIKNTATHVITYLHQTIIQKIDAFEKDFNIKKLHKIRISLKKLRYLLEEFQHIFGEEKIAKMINKGKKLQTILGDFNDTVNQKNILHDYLERNKLKISDRKVSKHALLDDTIQIQEKLMIKARKKLQQFKEQPLTL